jgi:Protein of unknown function (DUF3800)
VKIFIDDSGGFSWTAHGVSLFCAVNISDRTFKAIEASFNAWKSRQPYFTDGSELKGTDLSALQQASFVNSVVLDSSDLTLTLAGTKTTLFERNIAQQYVKDAANILWATSKSGHDTNRPLITKFYRRMARWIGERSPENLMWIICLGNAIHLSIQHAIVQFAEAADDSEFEVIEILIDQSFIEKTTHIEFWDEWLRNSLYTRSLKAPMMVPKEWFERDHPFNRQYGRAPGFIEWSDLFRNHVHFAKSKESAGVQIC